MRLGIPRILTIAAVVSVGISVASGAGIYSIGVLDAGSGVVGSKVYAISPDGKYAVGGSQGRNHTQTDTMAQAVVWSASSGLVQLPNNPSAPYVERETVAKGVVVKANGEIGIAAYYASTDMFGSPITDSYRMNHYTASPGALGNGTYAPSVQNGGPAIGMYNAARNFEEVAGVTGNTWSIAGTRVTGNRAIISLSSGIYSDSNMSSYDYTSIWNIASRVNAGSSRGYGAGSQKNNATGFRRATFGIGNYAQYFIPGTVNPTDSSLQSETLGMTPYTTHVAGSGVLVGYDADTDGTARAFAYTMGGISGTTSLLGERVLLSELPGAISSQAIDVRLLGPAGQQETIIGGFMTFDDGEQAVIWDKTGTWVESYGDDAWSVYDLLVGAGVDMSNWQSLSRITSMSDDGKTVGGWGIWAVDGSTRGFVATIPEPASLLLLSLGGLVLLSRNRR